jgi:hypothetical protein
VRKFGNRLKALAALAGVLQLATGAQAQSQEQDVNCRVELVDPKDLTQTRYGYSANFPFAPGQGPIRKLGNALDEQVVAAIAPLRANLDTALTQPLPVQNSADQDALLVEFRQDPEAGVLLRASILHRPFHLSGQPRALEMFAVRTLDQSVLARSGNTAGQPQKLELGADMMAEPFSIVIVDERGETYYRADYAPDLKSLQRRGAMVFRDGRQTFEGASYDPVNVNQGPLANCHDGSHGSPDDYGCFLTTATVSTIGLPDDCWELRQLRAFRDRFAARGPRQQAAMRRYYAISPGIVRTLAARPDGAATWRRFYFSAILPAALAARLRCDRVALALYRGLVRDLVQITRRPA